MWAAYAVLAVLAIAYVVLDAAGVDWSWLDGWGVDGFEIVTGFLCILKAADLKQRPRRARRSSAIGLLCWAAGDVVLTIQSLGGATPPSPSLADGFYLAFYPVTYFALMLLLRRSVRRFSLAGWLDGAVAGFGAAAVCATFAFKDVLHHAGGSAAGVAVNLAYPVGDVLLLGLVVGGAAIVPGRRKLPWLLLGGRLCAQHGRRRLQRARHDLARRHGVQRHRLAGGDPARVDRGVGALARRPAAPRRRASRIRPPRRWPRPRRS